MTETSAVPANTSLANTSLGRRFLEAVDAASQALVKGIDRMLDGAMPAPQLVPVRVSRGRRGRG